jgi:hypothetical protein
MIVLEANLEKDQNILEKDVNGKIVFRTNTHTSVVFGVAIWF